MKVQVRRSVFETNSSTCHTIVITRNWKNREVDLTEYDLGMWYDRQEFNFHRGVLNMADRVDKKMAYIYMAILYYLENRVYCKEITPEERDITISLVEDTILEGAKESSSDENVEKNIEIIQELFTKAKESILKNNDDFETNRFRGYWYIEHPEEAWQAVESILKDFDKLKRLIFDNESYITVCGDEYYGHYAKRIGFEYDYDWNNDYQSWYDKIVELKPEYEIFT